MVPPRPAFRLRAHRHGNQVRLEWSAAPGRPCAVEQAVSLGREAATFTTIATNLLSEDGRHTFTDPWREGATVLYRVTCDYRPPTPVP